MNCPLQSAETAGLLLDYRAGRAAAAGSALETHVQECVGCASFLMEQDAVWDALDDWHPAPVSADFNRRLWQRIDALEAEPWYQRIGASLRFANWRPAFPLAAAALVISAGFLLDHRGAAPPLPRAAGISIPVSAADEFEADQVEQALSDLELLHQFNAAETSRSAPM